MAAQLSWTAVMLPIGILRGANPLRGLVGLLGFTLSLSSGLSCAQAQHDAAACVGVADDAARLACYDAALRTPRPAVKPAVKPTVTPAGTTAAEGRFGDTGQLPSDAKARAELPKTLTARLQAVHSLPNGRYRLQLDNGQVWQTTEADWAINFDADDTVTITRMALGGYQIAHPGNNRSIGVRRLQ